jgi:hypothetical protein
MKMRNILNFLEKPEWKRVLGRLEKIRNIKIELVSESVNVAA